MFDFVWSLDEDNTYATATERDNDTMAVLSAHDDGSYSATVYLADTSTSAGGTESTLEGAMAAAVALAESLAAELVAERDEWIAGTEPTTYCTLAHLV